MEEKVPNLMKNCDLHIQEAQLSQSWLKEFQT